MGSSMRQRKFLCLNPKRSKYHLKLLKVPTQLRMLGPKEKKGKICKDSTLGGIILPVVEWPVIIIPHIEAVRDTNEALLGKYSRLLV